MGGPSGQVAPVPRCQTGGKMQMNRSAAGHHAGACRLKRSNGLPGSSQSDGAVSRRDAANMEPGKPAAEERQSQFELLAVLAQITLARDPMLDFLAPPFERVASRGTSEQSRKILLDLDLFSTA